MKTSDFLTVIGIGLGAVIMFLAALKTLKLRRLLVQGINATRWKWLSILMVFFFAGYLAAIALVIYGYQDPLLLITGLVFFFGSVFVYMVVYSAKRDIIKINVSNELLTIKNNELKKVNEELDQFASRTSHDLKAPINSIKGLINLAEISPAPEEVAFCFTQINQRLADLENIINDILDLSKNTRTNLLFKETNINTLIHSLVDSIFNQQDCVFDVSIDGPQDLDIYIDTARLKMVLGNLISNARNYSDPKKDKRSIQIKFWQENDHLITTIKDNGIGIAAQYIDKISDMFFRVEENSNGSGLGLYIVKEALIKMGGEISVASECGIGSEFCVKIPFKKADPNKDPK